LRTVITHFYNEAFLLPWWLKHHVPLFDHGVLIDYDSTDASADICRTLAPHWQLVRSRNREFDTALVDFEVMRYEEATEGWKIALNITEFLCVPGRQALEMIERDVRRRRLVGVRFPGACMVDAHPEQPLRPDVPLIQQKRCGFLEGEVDVVAGAGTESALASQVIFERAHLYHRGVVGKYRPGRRHSDWLEVGFVDRRMGSCRWYGFSPWRPEFIARKLAIQARLPPSEKVSHHRVRRGELTRLRSHLLAFCRDLPLPDRDWKDCEPVTPSKSGPPPRWSRTSLPVPQPRVGFFKALTSPRSRAELVLVREADLADHLELEGDLRIVAEVLRRIERARRPRSVAEWSRLLGIDPELLLAIIRLLAERRWLTDAMGHAHPKATRRQAGAATSKR
jgi:hypothetical protein